MELGKLTWLEARDVFHERAIALVPIGTTEPHGPHLPLDTDVTIAQAQARRAAERLEALGQTALVLPPVAYGVTHFAEGFAGRFSLRPGTLWNLLEDLVDSLEEQGVWHVVFVNGHLEPAHVKVLRGVALDFPVTDPPTKCPSGIRAQVIFPDNTRRRWAGTLGAEFASGDCHAGSYETSIVQAMDPDAVREAERAQLPPVSIGLVEGMQAGKTSFRELGADAAYCGDPAAASAAEGEELVDALAHMTVETVREAWPSLFGAGPASPSAEEAP